ncbi:MAG: hypothetical protein AAF743_09410, partial [Planctomycetota bacterium]
MRAMGAIRSRLSGARPQRVVSSFAIAAVTAALAGGMLVAQANPEPAAATPTSAPESVATPTHIVGTPGFWRIERDEAGVWWFLSPDGEREFLNTVTTVQPFQLGRRENGPHYVSRDWTGETSMDGDIDAWATATLDRVLDAGFKGMGAWSHPVFHEHDVPITRDLNIWTWMHGPAKRLYHPDFKKIAEQAVEQQVTPLRDNRNLVGYYTDNELDWSDKSSGPATYFDGWPPCDPNRRAVMRAIRQVWADIDAFNADWFTDLGSFDDVDKWTALPRKHPAAYNQLLEAFRGQLAADYFQITSDLVRKYDPNHLVLGVRYKGWA